MSSPKPPQDSTSIPNLAERRLRAARASGGTSSDSIHRAIEGIIGQLPLGNRLLDYGAGKGELSDRIVKAQRFKEVYAVDIIAPDEKNRLEEVNWIVGDLNEGLAGYDQYFDVVIAAEVIEHLENPRSMARDLYRLVKPGGIAMLTTPNTESWRSLLSLMLRGYHVAFGPTCYPAHITPLLRIDLARIVMEAGFHNPRFYFTDCGGIPGSPTVSWQAVSLGLLKGLRFSDNIILTVQRPPILPGVS